MAKVVHIFEAADYEQQIAAAADEIRAGNIVVLPTETVYGAAGLIANATARQRLNHFRGDDSRPLTIHLAKPEDARQLLGNVSELGNRMMRKLWPGPVALLFDVDAKRRAKVAAALGIDESELYHDGQITLRCPDQVVAQDVLARVDGLVALTLVDSTNLDALGDKFTLALDAGPARFAKPSTIVRVHDNSYEIVREGVYDKRIIERLLRTTILFICSGNTCRSPMAEAIARHLISQKLGIDPTQLDDKGISIMSAGSFAMNGARATPLAVDAVRELGADLSKHRSRPLSVELIHQADQIYAMGRSHAAVVTSLVPAAAQKTATLNPDGDIEDPIGLDAAVYQSLARRLSDLIEAQVVEKIVR